MELGVIDLPEKGNNAAAPQIRWLDLNLGETGKGRPAHLDDGYLGRVDWRPDGKLVVQLETRDQQSLQLVLFVNSILNHQDSSLVVHAS